MYTLCVKDRRRRIIARTGAFVLLGAIVNVAVAWAAPMPLIPGTFLVSRAAAELEVLWWRENAPTTMDDPDWAGNAHNWGQRLLHLEVMSKPTSLPYSTCDLYRAGWPTSALEGARWIDYRPSWEGQGPDIHSNQTLFAFEAWNGQRWLLPFGAIWPGFATNTLFYAAILWLLFAAPFALRRRLRLKRGLCSACAYPIGESVTCTECGRAPPISRKSIVRIRLASTRE